MASKRDRGQINFSPVLFIAPAKVLTDLELENVLNNISKVQVSHIMGPSEKKGPGACSTQ